MIKAKYWVILGVLTYISILVYSLSLSLTEASLSANLEIAIDWFAASLPYFFIGGCVGFLFDYLSKKPKAELWLYLSAAFYLIGIVAFLFISSKSFFLAFLLPLMYGIFFVGAAYVVLVPEFLKEPALSKVVFDLIILLLFGIWLTLTLKGKNHFMKHFCIAILFLILTIGMIKSLLIFSL